MGIAKDALEGSNTQIDLSSEGGTLYFTSYLSPSVLLMTLSVTVRNVKTIVVEINDKEFNEIGTITVS